MLYTCDSTCATCNGPNPTNCLTCWNGSYLNGGSCQSCNTGCATCVNGGASGCSSCHPYFYL